MIKMDIYHGSQVIMSTDSISGQTFMMDFWSWNRNIIWRVGGLIKMQKITKLDLWKFRKCKEMGGRCKTTECSKCEYYINSDKYEYIYGAQTFGLKI